MFALQVPCSASTGPKHWLRVLQDHSADFGSLLYSSFRTSLASTRATLFLRCQHLCQQHPMAESASMSQAACSAPCPASTQAMAYQRSSRPTWSPMASRESHPPESLLPWQAKKPCILLLQTMACGLHCTSCSGWYVVLHALVQASMVCICKVYLTLYTAAAMQAWDYCVPQGVACGRTDRRRHPGLWPAYA